MDDNPDSIIGSQIDVTARDEYSIEGENDRKEVARGLYDEYNVCAEYMENNGNEEGWRHDAQLAAMVAPWVESEWSHVSDMLDGLLKLQWPTAEDEHKWRVQQVFRWREDRASTEDEIPDEEIEHPEEAKVDSSVLDFVAEQDYDDTIDIEERIRLDVLWKWHPEDYGRDPDEIERIDKGRAIHEIARLFDERWEYIYPEKDVRGWQNTLYVYDEERGIYRPRGENQIRLQTEALLGHHADNNVVYELESKLKRRNRVDSWEMDDARPDPHRLVVKSGVLDLRTGDLDSHDPSEYHRTRLDVDYNPEAECPEVDEFFHDIVSEDDVATLYRVVAHTLSKEYVDEKAIMLVGDGNNGKSTFLRLLEDFLGEKNISGRSLQELSEDKWAPADLHGSLANLSGDMSEQEAEDLSKFKQLTGGDTLTGDIKFEQPVRFTNHASLIFASNGVPDLPDNDMAVWQRWVYLNFPNRFGPEGNKDAEPMRVLLDRITSDEEIEGLLARCVEEYKEYHDGRCFFPSVGDSHEVRKRMKKAAEPVYRFVDEMCVSVDPADHPQDPEKYKIWTAKMRQAYREYARKEGLPVINDAQFGKRITNLADYDITKGESKPVGPSNGRNYVYKGVQLTAEVEKMLDDGEDDEDDDPGSRTLTEDYEDGDDSGVAEMAGGADD